MAFEAGCDGFWLACWLEARGVEANVIHPSSMAVSREHRRAKTDRLDTEFRLGIRNFKPTLRKAAERLATVHTPEAYREKQFGRGDRLPDEHPAAATRWSEP